MAYEVPPNGVQSWLHGHRFLALCLIAAFAVMLIGVVAYEQVTGVATRSSYFLLGDLLVCGSWLLLLRSAIRSVDKWNAEHDQRHSGS